MNIYNLSKEFIQIFDELEENGGEMTPELQEKLQITKDNFRTAVKNMAFAIKTMEYESEAIKGEQKRLKELAEKKERTINNTKQYLINAINQYGDTKKNGVKYVDYETGEISVRKSKAVDINNNLVESINEALNKNVSFNKSIGTFNDYSHDHLTDILSLADAYNAEFETEVTMDDLDKINADITISIPLKDLNNGEAYPAFREMMRYTNHYKIKTSVSKTELKPILEENGSATPNLAKIVTNESLIIK